MDFVNVSEVRSVMAMIKVHVLNFHSVFSHIEIVLENASVSPTTFYAINRWQMPASGFSEDGPKSYINEASSVYCFDIKADPQEIVDEWRRYWHRTWDIANILGENCAVAAQKFLTRFADIPVPSTSNYSFNHLVAGIMWPSFIPCPVTLPGRIMDNVKFHTQNGYRTIDSLPLQDSNPFIKRAAKTVEDIAQSPLLAQGVKLVFNRFNALVELYRCLEVMRSEAISLTLNKYHDAAKVVYKLTLSLEKSANDFLIGETELKDFMTACKEEIAKAAPKLEEYPGWQRLLGNLALAVFTAGIGYALAAYVNHKHTGNYTFFHSNAVNLAGSCIASIPDEYQEREAAINAMDIMRLGY